MSVPGGIDLAFNSAPELTSTPGTAVDVGNSIDPTTFAPVVSHAQNVQNTLQAVGQSEADASAREQVDAAKKSLGGGGGIFNAIGHAFQSIPGIHGVEHALGTGIHYLASPLREIQRDYRFVHTVWTKNGPVAGILATLGVTAGAAAGAYLGGGATGAIIGGEGAAALERQGAELFGGHGQGYQHGTQAHYNEGLAATADASSDPHMKISFGRDLSNALGQVPGLHTLQNTDKGFGKVLSGGADATADWNLDPVVALAKLKTGLKLGDFGTATRAIAKAKVDASRAEAATAGPATKIVNAGQRLLSGDLLRTMQRKGAADFFDRVAPGIQLRTAAGDTVAANSEQLNALYNSPIAGMAYRRSLRHIAGLNTGDIIAKYPEVQDLAPDLLKAPGQEPIKGLGAAQTAEQAHQVFVNAIENAHFADRLNSISVVPTRTLTRMLPSKLSDFAQNIDKNAPTVTTEGGAVTRATPRQSLTGAAVTAGGKALTGDLSGAKDALTGAIARKINTFSGQQPFALDPITKQLSTGQFSVDALTGRVSPGAARGIFNMFKFSMGNQRARYWTGQFLNADSLADQKRIWAEAHFEFLKAAGLPDSEGIVQEARKIAADASAGPMDSPGGVGGGNGTYGFGKDFGSKVDEQPAGDGILSAALHNYQTSHTFSYANFFEVKQLQRELAGGLKLAKAPYGRIEDMVARKYIGAFFKPLALVNAGFGLRVAMAEAIPEAMREGAMTSLRSVVATKAAKMQYKLLPGEDTHILAAAAAALGLKGSATSLATGIDRLLNDPIARSRAMDLVMRHQGHIAQGVSRTGEATGGGFMDQGPADKANQGVYHVQGYMKNQPQLKYKGDGTFNYFANDSANWDGHMHAGLAAMSQDPAIALKAKDLLSGGPEFARQQETKRIQDVINESPDALPFYISEAARLRGYANIKAQATLDDGTPWTAETFAARRVDAVRGITEGADDTVHTHLLEALANRRAPELSEVSKIPLESRPKQIFGENSAPYVGPNLMNRIVSYGFAHVVDPIINGLSRDPQYFTAYSKQLDTLLPAVQSGHLDQETAERIAETRAVVGMLPKIHNTALKSQFSMLARNYMPFYFAQEQALRRVGKVIATNPEALRQYQLVQQGLNDPGFVHTDDQGNRYFMYPHVGVLQDATNTLLGLFGDKVQTGLPLTVQGSMSSLQTLLPDFNMPGVSPLVSVPLNKLAGIFPELSPQVKQITGAAGFGASAFDALVPNTVAKAAWRVMNPNEKDATYANAVVGAMMASHYHGTDPGPNASDADKAAWINRIKNNARSTFIAKAIVGLVSPLAPQVSNEDPGLRDEYYKLVKKDGYAVGHQKFLKEHGSKAISYTIAQTEPNINGAYMPYTNLALNYLNSPLGQQLIHSPYSVAGAFLTPQAQGPGDIQTIHAELIRNHLRTKDTPQQFLDAIDVAMGNNAITPGLDAHKKAQADLANNPRALAAENNNWSDYLQTQQLNNPTWYNYWTSPERKNLASEAYKQLYLLFDKKGPRPRDSAGNEIAAPNTDQAQLVRGLLQSYTTHAQEMANLPSAPQRKLERDNWSAYLDQEAKNPLLYSVINAVFSRLDAAGVTPNGGGLGQQA